MRISNDILDDLILHVENELESGRKNIALDCAVVAEFLGARSSLAQSPETQTRTADKGARVPESGITGVVAESGVVYDAKKTEAVRFASLEEIAAAVAGCAKCELCKTRTNTVPGVGNGNAPDIMFIGEAPGADEDAQGVPFVGKAGQLLTKMIVAMGYAREDVFIANILKCRPPGNRTPTPEEMEICMPWLKNQIALVKPKCIVALGGTAVAGLLHASGITRIHGLWHKFEEIPCLPTFHPAYLLRFPAAKKDAWDDLKKVLAFLGRAPKVATEKKKDEEKN